MKNKNLKIAITLIMTTVLTCIMTISRAETYPFTFTVNPIETTAEVGDTITIDLGIADIDQNTDGINAIQGDLSYDETIFENVEIITTKANWSVTFNQLSDSNLKGRFVISNMNSVKDTQVIAQLKATVKSNVQASTGSIYLKNVFSSYGAAETAKTDKTLTVKITKTTSNTTQSNIVNGVVNQNIVNSSTSLPQTGVNNWIVIAILGVSLVGVIGYVKYKRMKI